MKILALLTKVLGIVLILLALIAFGSDLLPVEGVNFSGHSSNDGDHEFYKIVPINRVDPILIGFTFTFVGIALLVISSLVKKHLVK